VKRFSGGFGALRMDATETNLTCRFLTSNNHLVDTHVLFKRSAAVAASKLAVSWELVE
jgi:hypothetical protein